MAIINVKSKIVKWAFATLIGFITAITVDHFVDGTSFSMVEILKDIGIVIVIFTILYLISREFEKAKRKKTV